VPIHAKNVCELQNIHHENVCELQNVRHKNVCELQKFVTKMCFYLHISFIFSNFAADL